MLFRLSNIEKSYAGHQILRDVSFQINPGDRAGLVGRNGAGKTTVFKVILGEEAADRGEVIKMNGLRLGLLEQHVALTPGETVHTAALSAFQRIHDLEAEMRALELKMADDHSEEILNRYASLQEEFELADGFSYSARAEAILLGLGFDRLTWELKTETLSGGQRNRLGMVRLLLSDCDVLLLDEPTNHLDVDAVEWLEDFLSGYEKSFVIISHDRYFLDRTVNRVIEIENGRAVTYKGNYSQFLVEREERREIQRREYENQQALIAKTEEFIRRNIEGQKTKQAKSRRNMLERMDRVEALVEDRSGGNFKLKGIERAGQNVLHVEEMSVGYDAKVLAAGIDLLILRGECLGIIGANGTGKTTFLKTILGEIPALGGKYIWGSKTDIGYYSQQLIDLDARNEIIQELRRVAPSADNGELRSFLAQFLFFGEDVFKKVGDLSGGERGRLALAKLVFSKKNVLVLDEPTNHLDIPSREALEAALSEYPGTILTVSHDRFFLDEIATAILSFEGEERVMFEYGNYSDFHERKAQAKDSRQPRVTGEPVSVNASSVESSLEDRNVLSKNQRQGIEKRVAEIESLLPDLESKMADVTERMSAPEVSANPDRLFTLGEEVARMESQIADLLSEWESLVESLK
jgi:ATP-binding cassette subfamily F protein 3